jgi:hypothetical protein
MFRAAILYITRDTHKIFENKIIFNKNVLITGNEHLFHGNFTGNNNLYVCDSSDTFIKNNIHKFINTEKLFIENMIYDYKTLIQIQNKLNTNNKFNVFMNDIYCDKFMNYLETSSKYYCGDSFDNSNQVFPINITEINKSIKNIKKENIKLENIKI